MKYLGENLVSRSTVTSARLCNTLSFTLMLASLLNLDLSTLQILGVNVGEANFLVASSIVLLLLLINHIVHWYGDYLSAQAWNIIGNGSETPDDLFGGAIVKRLNKVVSDLEGVEKVERNVEKLPKLISEVSELRNGIMSFHFFAKFTFICWYLLVPLVIGSVAIVSAIFYG